MTRDEAWNLANHWIAAWNAHDLDLIMTHYEDALELTSPVAAQLFGASGGSVAGKQNLRAYFQRGLQAYPDLHFRLQDVLWGVTAWCSITRTNWEHIRESSWKYQWLEGWHES